MWWLLNRGGGDSAGLVALYVGYELYESAVRALVVGEGTESLR